MTIAYTPGPEQEPESIMARNYPRGHRISLHTHPDAQLLFAARGIMQVITPKGRWFLPPQRAVWLPPGTEHAVDILSDVELRALLAAPAQLAGHPEAAGLRREFVVAVGPLLREVILACFEPRTSPALRGLLVEVALHQLPAAEDAGTFIPLPRDPRAHRAAEMVLANPGGAIGLPLLADRAGTSARTLSRLFAAETGLSFKVWQRRARIMEALRLLSERRAPLKRVAAAVGYTSPAAFAYAFRQVTGSRPGDLLRARTSWPEPQSQSRPRP